MSDSIRVTWGCQERFAELSGDRNPFHVDQVACRRIAFGAVSVHGFHLVLAALDRLARDATFAAALAGSGASVSVTFRRPVEIAPGRDAVVQIAAVERREGEWRIDLTDGVWLVATIIVTVGVLGDGGPWSSPEEPVDGGSLSDRERRPSEPVERSASEIAALVGASGSFPVRETSMLADHFAAIGAVVGKETVASIAAMSGVIGMQLPGLHSLDSSFSLSLLPRAERPVDDSAMRRSLAVQLVGFDERFGLANVAVSGAGVRAEIRAFVRPEPVVVDHDAISGVVRPSEFAGTRWLVVGGTRGLGEAAAAVAAAGGALVLATGRPGGGSDGSESNDRIEYRDLEVADGDSESVAAVARFEPTHIVYCATPSMSLGAAGVWSDELFDRYSAVYGEAFERLLLAIAEQRLENGERIGVVWPSTASVDEPGRGLAEFTAAKAEGERRCDRLARRWPSLTIAMPRLGRLATDQTPTYVPAQLADPAAAILPIMRSLLVADDGGRSR